MVYIYGYLIIAMLASVYIQKQLNDNQELLYHLINTFCSPEEKRLLEDNPNIIKWSPFIAGLIWPYTLCLFFTNNSNNNDND